MEEIINCSGLGDELSIDDRKIADILRRVRQDLKNNVKPGASVSGRFWRRIHQIMSMKNLPTGIMLSCIGILEEASTDRSIRDYLVNSLLFVPLIADIFLRIQTDKNRLNLLELFERMSENYTCTVDEMVFHRLIKQLVQNIQSEDRPLAITSLSILINLCRKNGNATHHLIHQINMSQFIAILNNFNILGYRMNLILAQYTNKEDAMVAAQQINMITTQIALTVQSGDIKSIRHLTGLLNEVHENGFPNNSNDEQVLYNSINPVLDHLIIRLNTAIEGLPTSTNTVEYIFGLVNAVLQISIKSVICYYNRLMNATIKVVNENQELIVSSLALDIIAKLIANQPSVASTFCDASVEMIQRQLKRLKTNQWQGSTSMFVSLFGLLDAFLSAAPATALNLIEFDIFDGIWVPLIEHRVNPFDLEQDSLRMHLLALYLMIRCTEQDKDNCNKTEKVVQLLSRSGVHYLLARAINSSIFDLRHLVFKMARSPYFPDKEVSKISTRFHRHNPPTTSTTSPDTNLALQASCCEMNSPTIARIDQLLQHVQNTINTNGKLNNSLILKMYTLKLRDCNQREKSLHQRLQQALNNVTVLSNDLAIQSLEIEQCNSFIYDSANEVERLTETCEELRSAAAIKATSLRSLETKLDAQMDKSARDRRDFEQRLAISAAEVMNCKQQIETAQRKADADIKRFCRETKELQHRNEALLLSMQKSEEKVAEQAAEVQRLNAELAAKDAAIKQMEDTMTKKQSEIEEQKAIRDQIMNLVGKIGPKN